MSDVRVVREVSSVTRNTSDGALRALRGTRDGAAFSADWYLAHALEGRAYAINTATASTPDTLTANAGLLVAQQDAYITIPSGTTVIPVLIEISLEDLGSAGACDICACASTTVDTAVSATSVTIMNMRTDAPQSSLCTAYSVVSGNGTSPYSGTYYDFWRGYSGDAPDQFNSSAAQTNNLLSRTTWEASKTMCPPIITGAASLSVYATFTAGKGWITIVWVEIPSSSID